MSIVSIVTGAFMIGWVLPELVFLHSSDRGEMRQLPLSINLFMGVGSALLAGGIAA